MTCAAVVLRKGTTGASAAHELMAFLRGMGMDQSDIVMKIDGEAAMKVVLDDLAGVRPTAKTIREERRHEGRAPETASPNPQCDL